MKLDFDLSFDTDFEFVFEFYFKVGYDFFMSVSKLRARKSS